MGRLDRFKKLERARPDAPTGDRENRSKSSFRFGNIEAPKEAPAKAAPDPFAPPPEPDVSLEVAPADPRDHQRKNDREEQLEKELALEAQRRAEIAMRREAQETALDRAANTGLGWWNGLTPTRRTQLAIGSVAVLLLALLRYAIQ